MKSNNIRNISIEFVKRIYLLVSHLQERPSTLTPQLNHKTILQESKSPLTEVKPKLLQKLILTFFSKMESESVRTICQKHEKIVKYERLLGIIGGVICLVIVVYPPILYFLMYIAIFLVVVVFCQFEEFMRYFGRKSLLLQLCEKIPPTLDLMNLKYEVFENSGLFIRGPLKTPEDEKISQIVESARWVLQHYQGVWHKSPYTFYYLAMSLVFSLVGLIIWVNVPIFSVNVFFDVCLLVFICGFLFGFLIRVFQLIKGNSILSLANAILQIPCQPTFTKWEDENQLKNASTRKHRRHSYLEGFDFD